MLIKATEYFDEDIPALKEKLFNPSPLDEVPDDQEYKIETEEDELVNPGVEPALPDVLDDMRVTRGSDE